MSRASRALMICLGQAAYSGQNRKNSSSSKCLPVCLKRTLLDEVGMSQMCHEETHAPQQFNSLLYHIVAGPAASGKALYLCGLEANDQLKFRRLLKKDGRSWKSRRDSQKMAALVLTWNRRQRSLWLAAQLKRSVTEVVCCFRDELASQFRDYRDPRTKLRLTNTASAGSLAREQRAGRVGRKLVEVKDPDIVPRLANARMKLLAIRWVGKSGYVAVFEISAKTEGAGPSGRPMAASRGYARWLLVASQQEEAGRSTTSQS